MVKMVQCVKVMLNIILSIMIFKNKNSVLFANLIYSFIINLV